MSTGLATLADLVESVRVLEANGCKDLVLLKCTSSYPASPANSNLATIPHMAGIWPQAVIGLSDHTLGIGASVAAIALGARVIEKHFTLRREDGGVDSAFSLEPDELKALVVESERAYSAGEAFTAENVRVIRPGDGLEPKYFQLVLGRSAKRDLEPGHALRWEDI
jgi:sialic acid synthase SpsE